MKFVALALALLLAIGAQAASLQADAPSQLDHARGVMRMYLEQIKTSVENIAKKVDDEDTKNLIIAKANALHDQIITLQDTVKPFTDSAVATIAEATQDLRTSINNDLEVLKTELQPMRAELNAVVEKHINEYKELLQPFMDDYRAKQEAEMAAMKAKLEPIMEQLRAKIAVNVEETKSKLVPIIDTVRDKITERIETVKQMVDPYVQEYKEQMMAVPAQFAQIKDVNFEEVRQKLTPHLDTVKNSFEGLIAEVKTMLGQ